MAHTLIRTVVQPLGITMWVHSEIQPHCMVSGNILQVPLAPMGVLAQSPIDTSGNFSVHVSGRGKQFLINFLHMEGGVGCKPLGPKINF